MTTTTAELMSIETEIQRLTDRRTELQRQLVGELEATGTLIRRPSTAGSAVDASALVHILTQTSPDGTAREFAHLADDCTSNLCGVMGRISRDLGDTYRFDGTWRVVATDPDYSAVLICVPAFSCSEWSMQAIERKCEHLGADFFDALADAAHHGVTL